MKSKVRVIDTLSYSTFHEVFNSSVVCMCTLIFERVQVRSSPSAKATTQKLIKRHNPNCTFEYKPLKVIERDDTIGGFLKYLLSGWLNFWQFLIAPRSVQLIYTNNNPLSLIAVTLFNLLLKKEVAIFCHGELDLLIRHPRPYKPAFYYRLIFKLLFKYGIIGRHTKMFVLGDSILENLQPYLNKINKKQFYSIEHPYFFTHRTPAIPNSAPKVGTVGAMTYAKGLQTLLELSQHIKLTVVGRVMEEIDFDKYPNIDFLAKGAQYIPREQYEKAIEKLDFILFLYPTDSYQFIASGAIFDAMDMNKPIITLDNNYFSHVLKLPIGYVAKNEAELLSVLENLKIDENYNLFLANIEKLKSYFTPEEIAVDFRNILQ